MIPHSVLNLPDGPRMLDVLREGFGQAEDAAIAVAFTRSTGLQLLKDPIEEFLARGGRLRLLTSTYLQLTEPQALQGLLSFGGALSCRVQQGPQPFHSKFWLFRDGGRSAAWVGSSNLTRGGLSTNLEWNLCDRDPARGEELAALFERLWARPDVSPLDEALIHRYREGWARRPLQGTLADSGPPEPNPAQREALARLAELRQRGVRRAAVIAATGLGKTLLAAFDALAARPRRLLYVSHRLEHLHQARDSFARLFPSARLGVLGGGSAEVEAPFLFATVDSVAARPQLCAAAWDYLIIDEFHHAAAPSYRALRPARDRAFLLGLTATPERMDGRDVLEWCDQHVACEIRLHEAVERAWLIPFHYFGIADETVDFSRVIPWRGAIPLEALERALSLQARAMLVLREARRYGFAGRRRATVGFCAGVRHARFMADAFNAAGEVAAVVTGADEIKARRAIYARFADPDDPLEWLFVADILNEGVDIPAINSLLLLRPTESPTIFLQQLGRGLRLHPDTPVLTVLDFVGHHRAAWLPLQAIDSPTNGGRRPPGEVAIRPPAGCEVVLQRRTQEILARIKEAIPDRRARLTDAWRQLRAELGRSPLPLDLWRRDDLPPLAEFRKAWPTWIAAQRAMGDAPAWAERLPADHPVFLLLSRVEADWQLQRVPGWALAIGLATHPDDPAAGYAAVYTRHPQFRVEEAPIAQAWAVVEKRLPGLIGADHRLLPEIRALGAEILGPEVSGRAALHALSDHEERHCGLLGTPDLLRRLARYRRPEIVRLFGQQYDPARHNRGIMWFGADAAIICKLDTSNALPQHQYMNRLLDPQTFLWTSQNQMEPGNAEGRRVLEHVANGERLHLFVQATSHTPACYLGQVEVRGHEGSAPMRVRLRLSAPLPEGIPAG